MNKHFNPYMYDIGNLRSHHWKYWIDVYENCAYDCKYCVYRAGDRMGKIRPLIEDVSALRQELIQIDNTGIVYLGPKADIYQPQDKRLALTRKVLEVFSDCNVPTFIVTRSELLLRDLDIFSDMAERGLIELSISIASPVMQPTLEPNTPAVETRLRLIGELRRRGIPVSVHLSPIIPYLDNISDIKILMERITDMGADCIYACILGMADRYHSVVRNALQNDGQRALIDKVYATGNRRLDIYSAEQSYIHDLMLTLSDHASKRAIPFACVHIPEFDTIERSGHIFRFKLPNVGDIVRHFTRMGRQKICFLDLAEYVSSIPAVDDIFIGALRKFWDEGTLFKNTFYHQIQENGEIYYVRKHELDLLVTNMRVEPEHQEI